MRYPNEKTVCTAEDGMTVSVFSPSLLHLLPKNSGNLETERGVKLRFFYRMLIGCRIYVMRKDDAFISYAMFQKGKIARYPFVGKNMLLMGPYFVSENYRGQGYAGRLLSIAFQNLRDCRTVYAWIAANNAPSRACLKKAGFCQDGWLNADRFKKEKTQQPTNHELWKKNLTD